MKAIDLCPRCKSTVRLDYVSSGDQITSIAAKCTGCGAEGSAPVVGVSVAAGTRRNPSPAVQMTLIAAHHAALQNIGHRQP